MTIEHWSHFFKPEVRNQGFKHFEDGDVFLKIKADTQIQAYVKSSSPIKISFNSGSISSPSFEADCTCKSSVKGQFCKHIWATLLAVKQQHPDFLDSKKEINKVRHEQKETIKHKQSEYRKEQYQKQKQKLKAQKKSKINSEIEESHFPPNVQSAIDFFAENGFNFMDPIDPDEVANARKILSKVFHPDKGGTHDEVLRLNSNYEILMKWSGG